jgi:hypothetical protein
MTAIVKVEKVILETMEAAVVKNHQSHLNQVQIVIAEIVVMMVAVVTVETAETAEAKRMTNDSKHPCDICRSTYGVLSLIKSFGTMDFEYKCADCIIKEIWKNTANKRN